MMETELWAEVVLYVYIYYIYVCEENDETN